MIRRIVIGCILCFLPIILFAQQSGFKIIKKIPVVDTLLLDTLSIIPSSFKIFNGVSEFHKSSYAVNFSSAQLKWVRKPTLDSVLVMYQTLPLLLSKKVYHKDPKIIEEVVIGNAPYIYSVSKSQNTVFNFEGFNKSGSISRGVGFGNNQDLSVNSNLVLQLAGKLNNDIEILAAISDDNIPIQPEGNTQQINDFDKVFIQLKRKDATFIAGDYELRRPDSYFTNFFKRTQGAFVSNNFKDKKGNFYDSKLALAVAKGRSARNLINGIEGNQGPYKLTGNNGEQFVIVLSGTERVFIDGNLMLRGQDNDYVIDYNTAELTFTTKKLITRYSRIVVEFEYSDKIYARSLYQFNQAYASDRLKLNFNYYSEQDNPNRPILQNISDDQRAFLGSIGNQINQAVFQNVDSVTFDDSEILYQKKDTIGFQDVYVYSTNPQTAKYRVGFSFLGPNRGNYKIAQNSQANGRVYEFVLPLNGISQGDYEPITLLITPKKQQLITLNTNYLINKQTKLFTEVGLSNNDANLFSDLQNEQNRGLAYKVILSDVRPLTKKDSLNWKLSTNITHEFTSKQFKPLERYRPVEFDRDFNFRGVALANATENWSTINLQLKKSSTKEISYTLANFVRENTYNAVQQTLSSRYFYQGFDLNYRASLLNSDYQDDNGSFIKQKFTLEKKMTKFKAGFVFEQERNRTTNQATQQLALQSFQFNQFDYYLKSVDSAKNNFEINYSHRLDALPIQQSLKDFSRAQTFGGRWMINKSTKSNFAVNANYRSIKYLNNDTLFKDENTLLGRIDYQVNALKGFANLQSFYELGTGQEPRREFIYLEVPAGQGIFAWNDYNNNLIKELNEFEIARYPDEARFIKVFRPTNEFIKSNFTNINQTLTLNASRLFKSSKNNLIGLIAKLSNISVLRIDRKVLAGDQLVINPYDTDIDLANLVSLNSFVRNTLFYNRSNPIFGVDFNIQQSGNKLLLTNGFDSRDTREQGIRLRANFIRKLNMLVNFNNGNKEFSSQLFKERNYDINYQQLQQELAYQFNSNFKTTLKVDYKIQNNVANGGGQKNNALRLGSEIRYNVAQKGTFTAQLNLINNKFTGTNNSAIAYELLDGLQPGGNATWSAGFQRTISNGIQLNFTYDGRKSNLVRTIHTGGLQVRAYF